MNNFYAQGINPCATGINPCFIGGGALEFIPQCRRRSTGIYSQCRSLAGSYRRVVSWPGKPGPARNVILLKEI
jgi:hypothetical protein